MEDSRPVGRHDGGRRGHPGAATIVMPSMKMKPIHWVVLTCRSWVRTIAKAKEKIFEVDPARWIVAHRGEW